jgi:hypothetical protein
MKKTAILALLLALAGAGGISADVRTEPIDVILALDKSLSMVEEIGAVIEYVNTYIIDQLLIPGDYFLVVAFYGKTETLVAMRITGDADKQRAKQAIARLAANGRFTDIGNALDTLGAELAKLPEQNRRKHLLLITDGIQEAPPGTRYYSRDGKFTHEFLENTKTIQKQGWKIEILGIGTHAGAGELAANLAAGYTELSEAPTAEEFIEKTRGFLSSVEITEGPDFRGFNGLGRGRLRLGLTSRGYDQPVTVQLAGIRLALPGRPEQDILRRPQKLAVAPGAPLSASLPLRLRPRLPAGRYSGEIRFLFAGEAQFTPVATAAAFQVNSLFGGLSAGLAARFRLHLRWWLLGAAVLVLLLALLLVLLLLRPGKSRSRFRLTVEGRKRAPGAKLLTIVEGAPMFLEEVEGSVVISGKRSPASLARLAAVRGGVRLTVLRSEKFPHLKELPPNILDNDLTVRLEGKKELTIRLTSGK